MKMDILISGNIKVLPGLEVLIYSTMFHNPNVEITWHLFTMDIEVDHKDGTGIGYNGVSKKDATWLNKIVKFFNHKSEVIYYDVKDYYLKYLSESVNYTSKFTPYASLRLLADIILPVDSCLYLDCDIIVQKEISSMYSGYQKKEHFNYAAYTIPNSCDGYGEMISGVMFLNLKHIRKTGFLEQARRMYNKNEYLYPDQMAIRDSGDPEYLDETYSYMYDYRKALCEPVIVHFSNENAPKIYDSEQPQGYWWRFNPKFQYIKDGLDLIKTVH